jgi:hypothetical protein
MRECDAHLWDCFNPKGDKLRQFSISNNRALAPARKTELTVDSGWDKYTGVKIDFSTSRGQTVTLSPEEWFDFVSKVEEIIKHCETELKKEK